MFVFRSMRFFKRLFFSFYYEFRSFNRIDPNILIFVKYGLLFDLMFNLYRPFSVKFLTRLGGNEFHISLFNSIPGVVAVFALIPGALFISRFRDKKIITAILFGISRLFLLFFLFTPFLPSNLQPLLFICLIGIMNLPDSISQSSLQSYLGDIFDGRSRGIAISARSKFGTIVVLFVTFSTGLILGFVPRNYSQIIFLYQIFFALAFTVGIFEIITFLKFKPAKKIKTNEISNEKKSSFTSFKSIIKNKNFVKYLFCIILFHITWHAGWPLGSIIQIIELGANEVWLSLFAVINGFFAFFSVSFWNKLQSKKGNNFTLTVAAFMVAFNAIVIAIAPNNFFMIFTFVIGGAAGIGATMSILNGLLELTPNDGRIFYFGIFNTLVNISLAASPFIAHYLITLTNARTAFMFVGVGRFITAGVMFLFFVILPRKNS